MPLHHTNDPVVRAGHIAERVAETVWSETGDGGLSHKMESEAYTYLHLDSIFQEFPSCPNEDCENRGRSDRVGYGHRGGYFCFACCTSFSDAD